MNIESRNKLIIKKIKIVNKYRAVDLFLQNNFHTKIKVKKIIIINMKGKQEARKLLLEMEEQIKEYKLLILQIGFKVVILERSKIRFLTISFCFYRYYCTLNTLENKHTNKRRNHFKPSNIFIKILDYLFLLYAIVDFLTLLHLFSFIF